MIEEVNQALYLLEQAIERLEKSQNRTPDQVDQDLLRLFLEQTVTDFSPDFIYLPIPKSYRSVPVVYCRGCGSWSAEHDGAALNPDLIQHSGGCRWNTARALLSQLEGTES